MKKDWDEDDLLYFIWRVNIVKMQMIHTQCRRWTLRKTCSYSKFFWSVSCIRTEYGPEKPLIRTLFTQWKQRNRWLAHFRPMLTFTTSEKIGKRGGYRMFSGRIKRENLFQMCFTKTSVQGIFTSLNDKRTNANTNANIS